MNTVSMFEAKTNLSKYVSLVDSHKEPYIIIVRNGKPVAKIVPYDTPAGKRIGIAKGLLPPMPTLDDFNSVEIISDFEGNGEL